MLVTRQQTIPLSRAGAFLILWIVLGGAGVVQAQEQEVEKWHLTRAASASPDTLVYRLEYEGLFTAFVWTPLADVVFSSDREVSRFQGAPVCRLRMRLSTENHKVENLYPYRYEWRSRVSPDLGKVYLVEEISRGVKEEHNVAWLDWAGKEINFYRKRNIIEPDVFEDGEEGIYATEAKPQAPRVEWEKDGAKPVPDFLNQQPLLDGKYTYLIHEKSVRLETDDALTEPLGLLFAARWADYRQAPRQVFNVSYKDEIRQYRVEMIGRETLEIGSRAIPAIKVKLKRNNEKEAEDEGYVSIWLSDDARRLPLQYEIDVVLGSIRLKLSPRSLQRQKRVKTCLDVTALRKMYAPAGKPAVAQQP